MSTATWERPGPPVAAKQISMVRSEEHTSELQSLTNLVCRLLLEKKNAATRPGHSRRRRERSSPANRWWQPDHQRTSSMGLNTNPAASPYAHIEATSHPPVVGPHR